LGDDLQSLEHQEQVEVSRNSNQDFSRLVPMRIQNHPFPLLLYLEWALLAIALLGELLPAPFRDSVPRLQLLTLSSTIGFGLMGLRLPVGKSRGKIAYTALELGLTLLATATGGLKGLRLFPFFCVVLVIRSCLIFKLKERLLIAGAAYLLFLVLLSHRLPNLIDTRMPAPGQERPLIGVFAFNSALLLGLSLLFVLLLVNALLVERQSREKLATANDQLRQYAMRVEHLAMAQERNRIARDIHDSLGHSLTALNLQLEGALKLGQSNPAQAQAFLQEAKRLGSTALREVRQSVAAMRADPVQGRSLAEAITTLVQDFQRTTGIQPDCQIEVAVSLSQELNTTLYRIAQEALTNVWKHAGATQLAIELQTTPTDLYLLIQDNGRGFQPNQNLTGFGLQGMRERTLAAGGRLDLITAPNQGCQIKAYFPLRLAP
jgi:signal transduction histidine kinase